MKIASTIILNILCLTALGQSLTGKVMSLDKKQSLVYANIWWIGTPIGVITDSTGSFEIAFPEKFPAELLIQYVGFDSDTIRFNQAPKSEALIVELKASSLEEVKIEGHKFSSSINMKSAYFQEDISEAELQKAACCNLSESFETNSSVEMNFTDAVTGIKRIQMLGLDGAYTMIQFENLPHVRGVTANTGLTYIPGNWIESIQLIKGSGSVVNGYESITGHINLEYKKPDAKDEQLFLNVYSNVMGRFEANSIFRHEFNDKWSSMLMANVHTISFQNDNNQDGFLDMPLEEGFNVFNRWKYKSKRLGMQFGISALADRKRGGQVFQNPERTNLFRYDKESRRIDGFFKSGIIFPNAEHKSTAILLRGRYHDEVGIIGQNDYQSQESFFHANWIYQNDFGEEKKGEEKMFRTGASFLYNETLQSLDTIGFNRTERVPGVFGELTWAKDFSYSAVVGLRSDFHNLYGTRLSPRVHLKYYLPSRTVLRLAVGKGFRAPNPFSEYQSGLISSRNVFLSDHLKAESAWNTGLALTQNFFLLNRDASLSVDLFHTRFESQLVADFENKDLLLFYNLDGISYSTALQGELSFTPIERLEVKTSAKYYDVRLTYTGELKRKPMVPLYRALLNMTYQTKNKRWQFDATGQLVGQSRLASTAGNSTFNTRASESEVYYLLNAQIRRDVKRFEIYAGVENIMNFIQKDAIIDPQNPFGPEFDASMVWGPVNGRVIYLGLNLKLFKQ